MSFAFFIKWQYWQYFSSSFWKECHQPPSPPSSVLRGKMIFFALFRLGKGVLCVCVLLLMQPSFFPHSSSPFPLFCDRSHLLFPSLLNSSLQVGGNGALVEILLLLLFPPPFLLSRPERKSTVDSAYLWIGSTTKKLVDLSGVVNNLLCASVDCKLRVRESAST